MRTTPSLRALLCLAGLAIAGLAAGLWAFVSIEERLKPEIVILRAADEESIAVGIFGAVESPGIYYLPVNSRLSDLLGAAGGPGEGADLSALNLSERLVDLSTVHLPMVVAQATPQQSESNPQIGLTAGDPRLELNSATYEQLDGLPLIGPVLAQAIIDERTRIGGFSTIEELEAISGISPEMVEELRQLVRVER